MKRSRSDSGQVICKQTNSILVFSFILDILTALLLMNVFLSCFPFLSSGHGLQNPTPLLCMEYPNCYPKAHQEMAAINIENIYSKIMFH